MFKRRQLLASVGIAAVSGLAGCSSSGSNGEPPENPVAAANPWPGTIIHLSGGSSPTVIRNAFNAEIPRILIASASQLNTAFISTEDVNAVEESAREADLETREVMNVSWNGGPVCDVQNWIQIPNEPAESTVREAFPNAICIFLNTSSEEETWEIYTPQIERSELVSGIEDLGVASESSFVTYSSCSTANTDSSTTESTTSQTTVETSPKEAVRSYLTAVFSGEVQAANALIHPDGSASEYTEEAAERNEALNLTIESLEITEESENTATVNTVVILESPEADEEVRRSQVYHLRTEDGAWKIYSGEEDEAA